MRFVLATLRVRKIWYQKIPHFAALSSGPKLEKLHRIRNSEQMTGHFHANLFLAVSVLSESFRVKMPLCSKYAAGRISTTLREVQLDPRDQCTPETEQRYFCVVIIKDHNKSILERA